MPNARTLKGKDELSESNDSWRSVTLLTAFQDRAAQKGKNSSNGVLELWRKSIWHPTITQK